MNILRSVLHKLAHLFNLQFGLPYSWYDRDVLMIGFRCSTCGDISGVHESPTDNILDKELSGAHHETDKA